MTPTMLLLAANLLPKDYKKNEKDYFIKYWELGNEISSNQLNPKKNDSNELLPVARRIFDSNDDLLSLSGLTPVKTVITPIQN